MNHVKVCFVGCGGIANVHAGHLSHREDLIITGCYDANPKCAEEFSDKYKVPVFKDATSLFDKTRSQAAYITVPPHAHGEYEIEAANRGIHLFIEKPVALDLSVARKIAAAIRNAKVLTSV